MKAIERSAKDYITALEEAAVLESTARREREFLWQTVMKHGKPTTDGYKYLDAGEFDVMVNLKCTAHHVILRPRNNADAKQQER